MVVFNIGRMKHYGGERPGDRTVGGFRGLKGLDHGGESFNFKAKGGFVFGYRPGDQKTINLGRLGAPRGAGSLDGVLVVWIAREPTGNTTRIVGWYRNATLLADSIRPSGRKGHIGKMEPLPYLAFARAADAVLLPVEHRTFVLQSARTEEGGFGMSPIWYGGSEQRRRKIWDYIQSVSAAADAPEPKKNKSPGWSMDPEKRLLVEKIAIEHAKAHYRSKLGGGYTVKSVETEAVGWDLEACRGDELLLIEVKGISGIKPVCELTHNEYTKLQLPKNALRYVIYMVTQCLQEPLAHIFSYQAGTPTWCAADGRKLTITEKRPVPRRPHRRPSQKRCRQTAFQRSTSKRPRYPIATFNLSSQQTC